MQIHTVWATRKSSPDEPELVEAWDEYSVDNNPEGFEDHWRKGLSSWGDDLDQYRHIILNANAERIRGAFDPVTITVVE